MADQSIKESTVERATAEPAASLREARFGGKEQVAALPGNSPDAVLDVLKKASALSNEANVPKEHLESFRRESAIARALGYKYAPIFDSHGTPDYETLLRVDQRKMFDCQGRAVSSLTVFGLSIEEKSRMLRDPDRVNATLNSCKALEWLSDRVSIAAEGEDDGILEISSLPAEVRKAELPKCATDYIVHHNQAICSVEQALSNRVIERGATLIHVDGHSDFVRKGRSTLSIADYINELVGKGSVGQVVWVVPRGTFVRPKSTDGHSCYELQQEPPYRQTISVSMPENAHARRSVSALICYPDQLPSFRGRGNIILDVDLDFFSCNSGISRNPTDTQIPLLVSSFASLLNEKEINPSLMIVCNSPGFTQEKQIPILLKEFHTANPADAYPGSEPNLLYGDNYLDDEALLEKLAESLEEGKSGDLSEKDRLLLRNRGWTEMLDLRDAVLRHEAGIKTFLDALDRIADKLSDRNE